jgi:hypothetical protein
LTKDEIEIIEESVKWQTSQRFTATHIAKSHKPTHRPKLGKECVCPTAPKTAKPTTDKKGSS